jgi:hypothetical protein
MSTNQSRRYIVGPHRDKDGHLYVLTVSRWFITVGGRPPQEVGNTMKLYSLAAIRKWGSRYKIDVTPVVAEWNKMEGIHL